MNVKILLQIAPKMMGNSDGVLCHCTLDVLDILDGDNYDKVVSLLHLQKLRKNDTTNHDRALIKSCTTKSCAGTKQVWYQHTNHVWIHFDRAPINKRLSRISSSRAEEQPAVV